MTINVFAFMLWGRDLVLHQVIGRHSSDEIQSIHAAYISMQHWLKQIQNLSGNGHLLNL